MGNTTLECATPTVAAPPRRPIVELLFLAMPTVLQMLAYTVEQFVDTLMLSRVGDVHAAAAGNAGGVVFAVISFGFGVLMLVNALVSQDYGAKRDVDCGRQLWQGIWFGLAYSIVVAPLVFAAGPIFRAMRHEPALIALEVTFFNVSVSLVVFKMLAVALGQFMIAINRPTVVLYAAVAGMFVNAGVNWVLIFGHLNAPRLGVAGAAWGTNSAVVTELLIVACVAFSPRIRDRFNTLAWRFDAKRFRELLRIGIPSGFQMAGDVFAWNIFFGVVMAWYGTTALAASIYTVQFMKLSFMPAFGLGTAVTALVARHIGEGRPDLSAARAHLGFAVAATYMLTCACVFYGAGDHLLLLFTRDETILRLGKQLLVYCAVFQFFDAMFIIYNGALRGARDTFVPAIVQIGLCWTLLVGGGLAVARFKPEWGIGAPWAIGCVYCAILGGFLLRRFRVGRWQIGAVGHGGTRPVPMMTSTAAEG